VRIEILCVINDRCTLKNAELDAQIELSRAYAILRNFVINCVNHSLE